MPHMNGFESCEKILVIDINVRICFMSAIKINREGLRETYPSLGIGCFIRKPVTMDYLLKRIRLSICVDGTRPKSTACILSGSSSREWLQSSVDACVLPFAAMFMDKSVLAG